MLWIPAPFITAFFMLVALAVLHRRSPRDAGDLTRMVACAAVLSVLVGLRWATGWPWVRALLPVAAMTLGPLAWRTFEHLRHPGPWRRGWLHALPVLGVFGVEGLRWPVDAGWVVATSMAGYGGCLMALARRGESAFAHARLADGAVLSRAAAWTGAGLVFSAAVDVAVALDFGWAGGAHSARVVSVAHVVLMGVMVWAAVQLVPAVQGASTAQAAEGSELFDEQVAQPDPTHPEIGGDEQALAATLARVQQWMDAHQAYRDPDLTLARLARKTGIAPREVSAAVNRLRGQNLSQWINDQRVHAAMVQLREGRSSVQQAMLDAGFLTKSNFNREFKRITGLTPSAYRAARGQGAEPVLEQAPPTSPTQPELG
jgi:AraC-like DNA-binding protein